MKTPTIAVMAGTPVDTRMGGEFLLSRAPDLHILSAPLSADPVEQSLFQLSPPHHREQVVTGHIRALLAQGADALLVYCNSLSGALDFPALCAREGLPVVTPLMACRALTQGYGRVGLLAANNQSLHGIEKCLLEADPALDILGVSLLPLVLEIERGLPPAEISQHFGLDHLLAFFQASGAQAILLGCTHFPYLQSDLARRTALPLLNPDDAMYRLLLETVGRRAPAGQPL